ncbi:hypothetical protein, partial [Escherichia coli]
TADRNRSHWSTSKTPSYTKSVSWQHHPILIRFNMVSLSCGPMQDFRPGKEKLYEYPAEITPSNFIHTLNLKSHYLHKLFTI